jgi:DNA-binding LacI/PurR family transcriptional regulator
MRRALRELAQEGIVKPVRHTGTIVVRQPAHARVCVLLASDPHTNLLLQSPVAQALLDAGCEVSLAPWLESQQDVETWISGHRQPRPFDALVVLCPESYLRRAEQPFRRFAERFPQRVFFSIDMPPVPDLAGWWLTVDCRLSARTVMSHLLELGHRRIGVFADYYPDSTSVYGRTARYCRDLVEVAGGVFVPSHGNVVLPRLVREERITAYWDLHDYSATNNLLAAQREGITVPREVSLVGRNDTPWSRECHPALTTLSWQPEQVAAAIGRCLAAAAAGEPPGPPQELAPHLIIRDSTAPCLQP